MRNAFADWGRPDKYGVPTNLLGRHPEAVYGMVGRVVMLSALLEDRQRTLLQVLTDKGPTGYAGAPAGKILRQLRAAAREASALTSAWGDFLPILDRAEDAFDFRNAVVHNLWPAQGDGSLFGHRQHPKTGIRQITVTSTDEVADGIANLVALIRDNESWIARAWSVQRLRRAAE